MVQVVRDYLAAYNRAARNPELVADMDRLTLPGCGSCAGLRRSIVNIGKRKERTATDTVSLGRHRAQDEGQDAVVFVHVRQRATQLVDVAGKKVADVPARDNVYRAFELRRHGGAWKISKIKTLAGGF